MSGVDGALRVPRQFAGGKAQARRRQGLFGLPFVQDDFLARKGGRLGLHSPGGGRVRGPVFPYVGSRLNGRQALIDPGQGDDPAGGKVLRQRLRQRFGQGRQQGPLGAGLRQGGGEGVYGAAPVLIVATVAPGRVYHQQAQVETATCHGGKGLGQARLIAPDEGVVVQGIGDGHQFAQGGAHALAFLRGQGPGLQAISGQGVGDQCRLAARAAQGGDIAPRQGPRRVQQLQGFQQGRQRWRQRDAYMPQKGLHIVVFPRQSGRVGQGDAGPVRALPQLAGRQRHAPIPGLGGGAGQGRGVFQGLQHHADGADAPLVQQGVQQGGDPQAGAVPQGDHHGQGQGASIHGQGEGDIAALRQDGDAAVDAGAPVLIRPQWRAI